MKNWNMNWLRVLPPDSIFHCEGWEVKLPSLMQVGWDLQAEELPYYEGVRIYGKHPMGIMYLYSSPIPVRALEAAHRTHLQSHPARLSISVKMGSGITIAHHGPIEMGPVGEVLAGVPKNMNQTFTDLDDFFIYNKDTVPEELVIDPENLGSALETIRSLQSDTARTLLHRQRNRNDRAAEPEILMPQLNAKIITFRRN